MQLATLRPGWCDPGTDHRPVTHRHPARTDLHSAARPAHFYTRTALLLHTYTHTHTLATHTYILSYWGDDDEEEDGVIHCASPATDIMSRCRRHRLPAAARVMSDVGRSAARGGRSAQASVSARRRSRGDPCSYTRQQQHAAHHGEDRRGGATRCPP